MWKPADIRRSDVRGVAFGVAALIVLMVLDLSQNPTTNFASALVVAPVLTAALSSPRGVAIVGVLAVAGAGFLVRHDAHVGAPGIKVGVVVVGSVVAVLISRDRVRREAKLVRLQSVAEAAQRAVLPELPAREGPAVVAGWYVSATEESLVGGDFYDVHAYQDRARWIIGDVKGKGISSVRIMAAVLGAFREAAGRVVSLEDVAVRIDERVASLAGEEDFVTGLVGELAPDGTVSMVNCGHPAPLKITSGMPVSLSPRRCALPFGLDPVFSTDSHVLSRGECVMCFTDGVTEGRTATGRFVDVERLARGLAGEDASTTARTVRERLDEQLVDGRFVDDTAVLVLQFDPAIVAPGDASDSAMRLRQVPVPHSSTSVPPTPRPAEATRRSATPTG
jgi:hypothetical protein